MSIRLALFCAKRLSFKWPVKVDELVLSLACAKQMVLASGERKIYGCSRELSIALTLTLASLRLRLTKLNRKLSGKGCFITRARN